MLYIHKLHNIYIYNIYIHTYIHIISVYLRRTCRSRSRSPKPGRPGIRTENAGSFRWLSGDFFCRVVWAPKFPGGATFCHRVLGKPNEGFEGQGWFRV